MLGPGRAQIWRYAPAHRRPRHFHSEPELNLIVAGSGIFGAGEAVLRVSAGDLLCWPPGQDHELIEASPDFDLFVAGLTPELSERVLGKDSRAALAGPSRLRLAPSALARFRSMCAVPLPGQSPSAAEAHVAEFWREAHALRLRAGVPHALGPRALSSLLERPELGRNAVALLSRADPSEVSRHFHQHTGVTLTRYRTRLRLLGFIQKVDAGRGTLLAAALDAGFGSYSQCHRAFLRTLGCTPRAFFGTDLRRHIEDAVSPWSPG